ncbi:hypothetical protein [Microbulbifer celer]|uniref:Uncharacterized protein n=1 Tax=Microbulbifer celer TaxID=435905 RepID=A0ABW3UB38_9GAMM|nr:hypothetical protein [Microbulbifer celer]UFN56856.1 hypothetical protein LPW13_14965 [Microbulbifer celer]
MQAFRNRRTEPGNDSQSRFQKMLLESIPPNSKRTHFVPAFQRFYFEALNFLIIADRSFSFLKAATLIKNANAAISRGQVWALFAQ